MDNNNINPALQSLQTLVGTWKIELTNASFLPDTEAILSGTVSFEWFEEGDFMIMRQGTKRKGVPWATWFIGRDQDSQNFTVLYIDDRRVTRVYEMSFEDRVWKIWRDSPEFSQRFMGQVGQDMKTIKASWEKSFDGEVWEHDFDITYIKEEK